MFDFGFWELMLVAIIGLLVLGPERLPSVAHTVGRYVRRIRGFANDFKAQIESEADLTQFRDVVRDEANSIRQLQHDARESIGAPTTQSIDEAVQSGRYARERPKSEGDDATEPSSDAQRELK